MSNQTADRPDQPSPVGLSPELSRDPYGEEQMDLSRDDFEAMLDEFGGEMQNAREGEDGTGQSLSAGEWAGRVSPISSRTRAPGARTSGGSWWAARAGTCGAAGRAPVAA